MTTDPAKVRLSEDRHRLAVLLDPSEVFRPCKFCRGQINNKCVNNLACVNVFGSPISATQIILEFR